ncbi:hypothetical protein BGZ61DRAFT_487761 [Ilyonectria robusta]|uniref:uncharacterized protein n=1 Tax=Ilyonectria robusta TaxID=1079257 RepID=UPI001E8DC7BC|nr:uncharacterized protein BGZ61DRAFT_487761 [Ilyonectria robusta]KAH8650727.1 hypothetical protein BGZ61DRAFT_487761 [Ilyonectria robusta]
MENSAQRSSCQLTHTSDALLNGTNAKIPNIGNLRKELGYGTPKNKTHQQFYKDLDFFRVLFTSTCDISGPSFLQRNNPCYRQGLSETVAKFLNNTKARHWSDNSASDNHGKLRHPQDAEEQVKRPFVDLPWTNTADRARSRALQEKKPQTYIGRGLSGSNGSQIPVGFPQQSVGNLHENRSPEDSLDDNLSEMLLQARPAIESHDGHRAKRSRWEEFIKMQPSSAATTSSSSLTQPALYRQTRTESASDLPPTSLQNASGVLEREHALPSTPTEPQGVIAINNERQISDIAQTGVSRNMDSSSDCATSGSASNIHPKKLRPHKRTPLLAKQQVLPDISFAFSINISKSTNKSIKLNRPFQKKTLSKLLSEFPLPGNPNDLMFVLIVSKKKFEMTTGRHDENTFQRVKDRFMGKIESARQACTRSSKCLDIEIEMGPRHFSDEDKESDDELIVF